MTVGETTLIMTSFQERSEDLYIDLFSNASLNIYPSNVVSSFTVKLDQPVELEGPYECALAQLTTPAVTTRKIGGGTLVYRFNVEDRVLRQQGLDSLQVAPFDHQTDPWKQYLPTPTESLPDVYIPLKDANIFNDRCYTYTLPSDTALEDQTKLLAHLESLFKGEAVNPTEFHKNKNNSLFTQAVKNRISPESRRKPSSGTPQQPFVRYPFSFEQDQNGVVSIRLRDDMSSLAISSELARALGFPVADHQWLILSTRGLYRAHRNVDLDASRTSLLCIYSSVVLPHHVGDTSAPLLRTCTLPHKMGTHALLNYEFINLHYLPVAQKWIQEIQVDVRSTDGSLIAFEAGVLHLRLHFRSRRHW
jgi:hypothetical protein